MNNIGAGAKRILIVEDEPAICDLCQRVLSSVYFKIDIAANGKVAQDMIEEKQYDLSMVDIKLPIMTGQELYHWLQEKHPQLVSRVIFTTGDVTSGDTQSFLEQTGRPFIPKPFTPAELKAVMRDALKEVGK